ncbi:MAG: hypothetical protein JWN98_1501 [Abditibacteriota bacterium]|nr:hypothetical protein [Abditibacteriota bacterium]
MQQPAQKLETLSAAQQGIEDAYQKYFAALKARDSRAMAAMLAPGFTWKTMEGETLDVPTTAELMANQVQSLLSVESATAHITDLSIDGQDVTFHVVEHITSEITDENGQPQKVKSVEAFRDTMTPTESGWKFKRAQTLSAEARPVTGE